MDGNDTRVRGEKLGKPHSALHDDEAYAHACGKYLELESMVLTLALAHGIPVASVWKDVVGGFENMAP